MVASILGWIATAISIIFLIPQIIKIIRTKSAKDLSLITSLITLIVDLSWSIYGILANLVQVYVTDLTVAMLALVLTIYQLIWRKNNPEVMKIVRLKNHINKMSDEEVRDEIIKLKSEAKNYDF